jgi:hypothetical protein
MPLANPGITATGGSITGNLSVNGNLTVTGTHGTTGVASHNAGTSTAGSAPVLTPAFAANTAAQLADLTRDYMVYLEVGTAGTAFVVQIGPANTTTTTVSASGVATSGEVVSFRLPAGWWVKWNATTATLANQTAIGC